MNSVNGVLQQGQSVRFQGKSDVYLDFERCNFRMFTDILRRYLGLHWFANALAMGEAQGE